MSYTPPAGFFAKSELKLSIADAYNLWSKTYDAFDNPMLAMVDEALALEPLNVNQLNVVELGCGTGRNYERVRHPNAASYTGFDQSEGMLKIAKDQYPAASFIQADIQKLLPIEAASTDIVFATLVYEHLESLRPTLTECRRILTDKGQLRILEIHPEISAQGTKAHFKDEDREVTFPCYAHTLDDWKFALSEAGFTPVSVKSLFASPRAIGRCAKLARHGSRAVLLDIQAVEA